MNRKEILDKMRPVFCDIFDIAEDNITEKTSAGDISEWDSMNQIILVASLEELFAVRFEMDKVMELKSVAGLLDYIEERK